MYMVIKSVGYVFFIVVMLLAGAGHGQDATSQSLGSGGRFLVVIDPGHGGKQLGAVGVKGVKEKHLVLAIARQAISALSQLPNVDVLMTRNRDQDVSLWDRVDLANKSRADLFISIHSNAFSSPSVGGVETFFHAVKASGEEARRVASAENAPSKDEPERVENPLEFILQDMQSAERLRDSSRFAHLVQAQLAKNLSLEDLGVMQADFIVLRGTKMPSVLLEVGFLTNRRDVKVLLREKTHHKVGQAIKEAVVAYQKLIQQKKVKVSQEGGSK
jgi:N-acetylmuramoyl-L-alanine amidase